MSNSSLISYTKLSPNYNTPRNHEKDTITPHVYVGQASVEAMCDYFAKPSTQASANYVIGFDGRIGLCVEEDNRSWCSSNRDNDNRAITIECACEPVHPYVINEAVMHSLILLIADICKRNNIKQLKWQGNKALIGQVDKQNMTVHRWFKNKACPGDYVYGKLPYITDEVNKNILGVIPTPPVSPVPSSQPSTLPTGIIPKGGLVKVVYRGVNVRTTPSFAKDNINQTVTEGTFTVTGISADGKWYLLKSGLYITTDPSLVKYYDAGITAYVETPVPVPLSPAKKDMNTIVTEVIAGKWGNGADRKNALTKAGYDYETVRKLVNQRLKK